MNGWMATLQGVAPPTGGPGQFYELTITEVKASSMSSSLPSPTLPDPSLEFPYVIESLPLNTQGVQVAGDKGDYFLYTPPNVGVSLALAPPPPPKSMKREKRGERARTPRVGLTSPAPA